MSQIEFEILALKKKAAYEKVKSYADEYYGRKYFYRTSFIYTFEEIGAAFTRGTANKGGLPSEVAEFFEDESGVKDGKPGKTRPVVRFSSVPYDDVVNGNVILDGYSDRDFMFYNNILFVVGSLDENGFVSVNSIRETNNTHLLRQVFIDAVATSNTMAKELINKQSSVFTLLIDNAPKVRHPDQIWIPTKHSQKFWRVWRSEENGPGQVTIEQDDSLHPFNYGSVLVMGGGGDKKTKETWITFF